MTRIAATVTLIAMLVPLAVTQDRVGAERGSSNLPFCPPKVCLYYAGDFDSSDYNANDVFNADSAGSGLLGQVWVGVKPTADATITGVTFNQFLVGQLGTNPTPFIVRVGIKPGHAGKTVCSTRGNATIREYQAFDWGIVYSYSIKKLSKPCSLNKGTTYYVTCCRLIAIASTGTCSTWKMRSRRTTGDGRTSSTTPISMG
jgi:hypothetical protein